MIMIRKGGVFLILLGIAVCLTLSAGSYLVIDQPPVPADAIVVFSGDRGVRMEKAAELFRNGYAPKILISGGEVYEGLVMAEVMKDHGLSLGIPESAMLLEKQASSTFQNAEYTCDILRNNGMDQALVVTSDFHTRRTLWSLDRLYAPAGIRYSIIAADDPEFTKEAWWSSNKSAMNTLKEYIKMAGYLAGRGN